MLSSYADIEEDLSEYEDESIADEVKSESKDESSIADEVKSSS